MSDRVRLDLATGTVTVLAPTMDVRWVAEGDQGPPGVSIDWQGSVPTWGDLPAVGEPGDAWLVDEDGHGAFWDTDTEAWVDGGRFQGPPGAAGPAIGGILTTKGDLVARDAATAVRVPVGSLKGMALAVDPAAAAGVAWAPPIGTVTLWADLPTYTTVPLGTRYHVTSGLGVLYALRGPTGWVVSADSDTGWLTVTERLNGFSGGTIRVNRTGPRVEWVVSTVNGTAATASQILAIASGFRVPHNSPRHVEAVSSGGVITWGEAWQYQNQLLTLGRGTSLTFDMSYSTLDAWPTVAPT